jgi:hypothetical protein
MFGFHREDEDDEEHIEADLAIETKSRRNLSVVLPTVLAELKNGP